MTLKYISGCICDSMTVDGVEEIDIPFDRTRKIALVKIGNYVSSLELSDHDLENLRDDISGYLCLEDEEVAGKSIKELGELIKSQDPGSLNYVLQFIIPRFGTLTKLYPPCECCGDIVSEYVLSL